MRSFYPDPEKMSAADFLFAPEVQKLLKVVYAAPDQPFAASELARRSKLDPADVARTLEHLVGSGILKRQKPKADEPDTVTLDRSFVFHEELRSIALKSFAAAEPLRSMLRSKFKDSVLRAFLLGEDKDGTLELLVVHGQSIPDEGAMAAACQKLSKTIHRHLKVHVISNARFNGLAVRDPLASKLAAACALEIVALGDTKAQPPAERIGLLQSAKKKLATLSRPSS
jgi:DNA-binding Lrp family transcriptional regulator